jgi:hypothetical protein
VGSGTAETVKSVVYQIGGSDDVFPPSTIDTRTDAPTGAVKEYVLVLLGIV